MDTVTKLLGLYASWTVALEPRVKALNTEGTIGVLKVTMLNIAWLVPSSMVSKRTSSSIVFVTRGGVDTSMGTNPVSLTSAYSSTKPRSVVSAEFE